MVLNVVHCVGFTVDEAADGSEALAERPHHHIDLIFDAEMSSSTTPVTENTNAMGIINHDPRAILLTNSD